MIVREICARSVLSKSRVYEYTVNPYGGCQHSCSYCYARFMKRFSGHREPWGEYVDVKINAPEQLEKEISKKKPGRVWLSGVCDPYQPIEKRYNLTGKCLEILIRHRWPITIQTRSPLVLRDLDLLKTALDLEVGFTVTTADDKIRRLFEPAAPPIEKRINALQELHAAGIRTFAMIAPLLPGAEGLTALLTGKVDAVRIDQVNYHYADWVFKKYNFTDYLSEDYFARTSNKLCSEFEQQGISCSLLH